MKVDIEFFDEDAMENVAACLKFRFDKVIFVGYRKTMTEERKEEVEAFLTSDEIGVRGVQFEPIMTESLTGEEAPDLYEQIYNKIFMVTQAERDMGNVCYFDLTGGEDVALVACGAVSKHLDVPMHQVSLHKGVVRYLAHPEAYKALEKRDIRLNVRQFIHLQRATIGDSMQKGHKTGLDDPAVEETMHEIFSLYLLQEQLWGKFTFGLQQFKGNLDMCLSESDFIDACSNFDKKTGKRSLKPQAPTLEEFRTVLRSAGNQGLVRDVDFSQGRIKFSYSSDRVKAVLCETGAILEIMTYYYYKNQNDVDDVVVGMMLDWDSGISLNPFDPYDLLQILREELPSGDEDVQNELPVTNEVDLIVMRNNIPIFVSCKNRTEGDNNTLYQLMTVANRFGGKTSRMALVCKATEPAIASRTEEMGIDIITVKDLYGI